MINIRTATVDDIPLIMQLEQGHATAAHWSEEQYRKAIEKTDDAPERLVLVAEGESTGAEAITAKIPTQTGRRIVLAGFLVARHVAQEWELENIVVAPEFRGQGIGMQLLHALLARARAANSRSIFLEVRESNSAARRLYAKAGFRETGRRKGYYSDPPEDAILYSHHVLS